MAFRSRETLEGWLEEFQRDAQPSLDDLRVIQQDGEGGADTGLLITHLRIAATETYIQPTDASGDEWAVVFEAREADVELTASEVRRLISDLDALAALCDFLRDKSAASRADVG